MIVVANRISVASGYEQAFEERFADRESNLRGLPGFIRNLVLRPVKGDTYIVMTFWEDTASFENWAHSDAFRQAHARPASPEMYSAPSALELHEVVHWVEA